MGNILLFSFFNSNNVGDRTISEIVYQVLSKKNTVTCCSMEGDFRIYHQYIAEELSFFEKVRYKICLWGRIAYTSPRGRRFLREYKDKIKASTAVVFGGGNIMMDYSRKTASYLKMQRYIQIAQKAEKDCYAISVGIGPFFTDWQLLNAVSVLNQCRYISFRDQTSYALFVQNGGKKEIAHIGIDPVFTMKVAKNNSLIKDTIALNIVQPSWYGEIYRNQVIQSYVLLVKHLALQYPKRKIVLFTTEKNDVIGMEQIYCETNELPNVFMEKTPEIDRLMELYSRSNVVIGARMHSLIIAFSCYVPVIGLAWTEKVRDFFNIIHQPSRCIDLSEIGEQMDNIVSMVEDHTINWKFSDIKEYACNILAKDLEVIE